MKIDCLRVNHLENPIGYHFFNPDFSSDGFQLTFSWKVSETRSLHADEVRLLVFRQKEEGEAKKENQDKTEIVYDSGVMNGFRQCQLSVRLSLTPRTRYDWNVSIRTEAGEYAESKNAWFETGKMKEAWKADWIAAPEDSGRMPILYRDFSVKEGLKKARLYLFGAGLYETCVNGKKAGNEYLLPGYHSYDLLMEYQTFDITKLLREGQNRVSVLLGEGWYKGRFGFDDVYRNLYGSRKKCIAEISLVYESEDVPCETEWIYTDNTWKAVTSNICENNIYDGEKQDDTLEERELSVEVLSDDKALLTERSNPPIKKTEEFTPVSCTEHEDGYLLLDFGESITGWVEWEGCLEKEQQIRLQYGETLQNGGFYRDNLRTAKAEFVYVSDGTKKNIRPHFTYYGFRYVKVEGLRAGQELCFRAYRIMSDIVQTGTIETSNPKVNRLIQNTLRSQKCNFLDIPTDCPQRDERMGWTGDVTIFAPTACFHMDSAAFFRHYTRSLHLEQKLLEGAVPFFSPRPKVPVKENTNPFYIDAGVCTWGDVATQLPWVLYQYYGDIVLLEEQYPMMKAWVEYIRSRAEESEVPNLWLNDRHLGDWLALDNGDLNNPIGKTDVNFLASAYYYFSVSVMAKAAAVLGLPEREEYEELAEKIRESFIDYYFIEDKKTDNKKLNIEMTQTSCAFLLHIGLYPEGADSVLIQELIRLLQENDGHLNTGFVGTSALCPALSDNGFPDAACDLLLQEDYPGWLHEVNLGATTVWERWNSLGEDGKISGTGMNSLNHYAYGSIADWMYRYLCGFRPALGDEIRMLIKPMPDKRFSFVRGRWDSVFGSYISEWSYEEKTGFSYHVEIPFNANAKIIFPNGESCLLESGSYDFTEDGKRV